MPMPPSHLLDIESDDRPSLRHLRHLSSPELPSRQALNSSSRKAVLASKAILNLSSKLINKSTSYLSSSQVDSNHSWQNWDNDTSNWHMQVGGHRLPDPIQHPPTPLIPTSISPSNYLSYFNRQNRDKRNRESYSEEHLVCFPGYAALRSPSYARAGDIQVFLSFHAFRAKKNLDCLNRSQRLVYSMICKLTGLPPLTANATTTSPLAMPISQPELTEHNQPSEDLISWSNQDLSLQEKPPTPPRPMTSTILRSSHPVSLSNPTQLPTKITMTCPTPIKARQTTPYDTNPSSSRSSRSSSDSVTSSSVLPPPGAFTTTATPTATAHSSSDVSKLHATLRDRLVAFFSQKDEGRQIRVQIYGLCQPENLTTSSSTSRLFGKISKPDPDQQEQQSAQVFLNHGRPLITQIVTTKPGGVWAERIVLPWQIVESHLRVHEKQLGAQAGSTLGLVKLRVEAELMPLENSEVEVGKEAPTCQGNRLDMDLDVIPSFAEAVHIISDIDDTIKQTNVIGGMKQILKNVFLSDYSEVSVPGMAGWYRAMSGVGCWMHYISNSPLELWGAIEGFLSHEGFPSGSVSLKEYARGAGSILSGILESSGARKRARVERILQDFPNSKFICVGDSGEQDLEMYVALAISNPHQILAIYIRDVTTPPPPSLSRSTFSSASLSSHCAPDSRSPPPAPSRNSIAILPPGPSRPALPPPRPPPPPRPRAQVLRLRSSLPVVPPKPSHLSSSSGYNSVSNIVLSANSLTISSAVSSSQTKHHGVAPSRTSSRSSSESQADERMITTNTTTTTTTTTAAAASKMGAVELLKARIRKAEGELERIGVKLRVFKDTEECVDEALGLVKSCTKNRLTNKCKAI